MDLAYKTCSFRLFLPYNSVMYAYMHICSFITRQKHLKNKGVLYVH